MEPPLQSACLVAACLHRVLLPSSKHPRNHSHLPTYQSKILGCLRDAIENVGLFTRCNQIRGRVRDICEQVGGDNLNARTAY